MDNVWVLFTGHGEDLELVRGPLESVVADDMVLRHGLTGEILAMRADNNRWVTHGFGQGIVLFRKAVIQAGGFESPWGDRGPIVGPA